MAATSYKVPYLKLKGLIASKGITHAELAEQLNMNRSTFSCKINRIYGRDFSFGEAIELSKILNVTISDFF